MRLNVCLICNEYPPAVHGGIGSVTKQLAEGLVKLGHQVWVVGMYDQIDDVVSIANHVVVHRFARKGRGGIGELNSRRRLASRIAMLHKVHRFDIIEAPEWRGDSALFRVDCPVVLRLHTSHVVDRMVTGRRLSRLTAYFEKIALTRANGICAVSGDIARKTFQAFPAFRRRVAMADVSVIHNAIELSSFQKSGAEREPGLIVFAGTLKQVKGVENLVKAFALVLEKRDCRMVLAGADTRVADGRSYLDVCLEGVEPGIRSNIEMLGWQPRENIPRLFQSASVVVLPSLQESSSMVAMEAMACGTPTVFGACGPHNEIMENGVDGLVCDPHDPVDIADKVERVLGDPEFASRMGTAARLRAEAQFGEERFLQQSIAFYQQTLQKLGRRFK